MRIVDFPEVAKAFDAVLARVLTDREPALIMRRKREAVVIVAASDWEIVQRHLGSGLDKSTS
jgi:PHD/YefM family antitoxin component YafN of YafNO toxin-antitoxin module